MNPRNGQTSLDYLNQIAPEAPKPKRFGLNLKTVLIVSAVLMIIVIIASLFASLSANSPKNDWQRLSAKLTATEAVTSKANSIIKNSQLRSINSNLKLYITNTKRDLNPKLVTLGVDVEKLPENIVAKENGTGMTERLETGRLNAKYDSTYAREMAYQLGTILALYQKLYASSNSAADKEFLGAAYENLKPTQESIANFSASNE